MIEALVAYEIRSQFLGREVEDSDLKSQVEFWMKAGYDSISLTVSMMTPGEVYALANFLVRKISLKLFSWFVVVGGLAQ